MTEPYLSIFPSNIVEQLVANWTQQQPLKGSSKEIDFKPVCKLFLPWTSGTWLVTELSDDFELAFGLADLGYPEMGYFSIAEIYDVQGPGGLRVELDQFFEADKTLSQYAADAKTLGYIRA